MELMEGIPRDVVSRLGYYVYAYVNPIDDRIFYVGKGKGQRVLSHGKGRNLVGDASKATALKQIRAAGKRPRLEILAHGLDRAETALQIEAAVIDALGLPHLTNQVRGWRSAKYGRMPLDQLIALYRRRPIKILEPSILIRINELYRPTMTSSELYDATRASWKIGPKRTQAQYAFAVFEGIVREVYEIASWLRAGSTLNSAHNRDAQPRDRWEFVGRLAPGAMRRRYLNRDVSRYFPASAQNPIRYVGIWLKQGSGR